MLEFADVLARATLFSGIEASEIDALFVCLGAKRFDLAKDDFALRVGEPPVNVGVVAEGRFHVIREDFEGERTLIASLEPGDHFAESLCCAGVAESPVSVVANTPGVVWLLSFRRILQTCPHSCTFHGKLLENMLGVLASKNLEMQARMELLSQKSIRARLMRYLETVARKQGNSFVIPFNREELADYLCIDRSALSRELGRLKSEGVIDFWKNNFKLL